MNLHAVPVHSRTLRRGWALVTLLTLLMQGGCRAQQPWPLWESYAAKFVDNQGRVIDHAAGERTTTEGEAYAMFFALVANDRSRFDKLVDWTEANLAQGDLTLHLPAWSWGKAPDGAWRVLDANPAADADLWMAYSLEEAGRLWHNDRYARLGSIMAARVAQQEVVLIPDVGTMLLPGAKGFHPDPQTWYVNPSYLPPFLLAYFAHSEKNSPWGEVLASLPAVINTPSGYAMDWMRGGSGGMHPSPAPSSEAATQPSPAVGSYDAIRVYLWLGLSDPQTPSVKECLGGTRAMAAYLDGQITPPLAVDTAGKVLNSDAPTGFSAAVIPYLHAMRDKGAEKQQTDRLFATKDSRSGLFGREGTYYDQNLALFATGWMEQKFRFDAEGRLHLKWK